LRRSRWGLVELHFDDGPLLVELRSSSLRSFVSRAVAVIGLELEPEDEARRLEVFESWDAEEKEKRARGFPVRQLVEEFRLRAIKAEKDEARRRRSHSRKNTAD
jgi:hypothetical protein